jgi:RNA polymerase sigma-70 factor, ECF subfamily
MSLISQARPDGAETGLLRTAHERAHPVSEEAAQWIVALKRDDEAVRASFVTWIRQSPEHFSAFLRVSAEEFESGESAGVTDSSDLSLVEAVAKRTGLQNQLYVRYRRPLLQVFLHRRIARDAAEDLLQRTFLLAIKKIRTEGLDDPSNLGGYLYRTACKLATAYWRGELSRRHDSDRELLSSLRDEAALSLEERLDHEQLAKCVRDLMGQLPLERDREVLERYYLHEEPPTQIRESLQLTDMQFNQLLWRARQRFGDILRRHGMSEATI